MPVLVVDNGAYNIKAGYAEDAESLVIEPNAITRSAGDKKVFVGSEIESCRDITGLQFRRPHEKGMLANWECQKVIWDRLFYGLSTDLARPGGGGGVVDPSDTSLILTEMPLTLPALSSHTDQMVFEEYGFDSYYRCTPQSLIPWNDLQGDLFGAEKNDNTPVLDCALVIDSGFSATQVIPVVYGEVYWPAVRRIDVGGKLLTNYLRETTSFRHYNMMADTYLMNLVKEQTCFVSDDFARDIELVHASPKNLLKRFLLPNFENPRGRLLAEDDQTDANDAILNLQNERFTVPELLFSPKMVGIDQEGIPGTVLQALTAVPKQAQSLLLANVVLTGGTTKLPGYVERVSRELRSISPQHWNLRVGAPDEPDNYAWYGGCALGRNDEMLKKAYVTRAEYLESGSNICLSKFGMKVQDFSEDLERL
ncbi:actin-like protein Arp6p [Trichomonascus vanleenenianus]|uniref:Arp6p n=1 Tax=Trichomonascus vanleenenianus TaxID=2268995 RepID=UPI003ECA8869